MENKLIQPGTTIRITAYRGEPRSQVCTVMEVRDTEKQPLKQMSPSRRQAMRRSRYAIKVQYDDNKSYHTFWLKWLAYDVLTVPEVVKPSLVSKLVKWLKEN